MIRLPDPSDSLGGRHSESPGSAHTHELNGFAKHVITTYCACWILKKRIALQNLCRVLRSVEMKIVPLQKSYLMAPDRYSCSEPRGNQITVVNHSTDDPLNHHHRFLRICSFIQPIQMLVQILSLQGFLTDFNLPLRTPLWRGIDRRGTGEWGTDGRGSLDQGSTRHMRLRKGNHDSHYSSPHPLPLFSIDQNYRKSKSPNRSSNEFLLLSYFGCFPAPFFPFQEALFNFFLFLPFLNFVPSSFWIKILNPYFSQRPEPVFTFPSFLASLV